MAAGLRSHVADRSPHAISVVRPETVLQLRAAARRLAAVVAGREGTSRIEFEACDSIKSQRPRLGFRRLSEE